MKIISEQKLKKEIEDFLNNAIDAEYVNILHHKFGIDYGLEYEDLAALSPCEKEILKDDLIDIINLSFESEMVDAIKLYQIINCYSFCGVTKHSPPRFKFKEMSAKACKMFLISEGIIDEPV